MTKQPDAQEPTNSAEEAVETPETPTNDEFAGYESVEAMRDAIYASRKEGKRLAAENAAASARIAEIERQLPSSRAAERRALDEINDLGLPAELFERAVDERFEKLYAPKRATEAAVARVRRDNPDFVRFESEFTDWLADNPHVQQQYSETVASAPNAADLALEGVFSQFSRDKARDTRRPEPAKLSPDAALPNSQNGNAAARRPATQKLSREDLNQMIKGARDNSNPVPLMRAILGNTPIHRDIEALKGK